MEGSKMKGYINVFEGKAYHFSEGGAEEVPLSGELSDEYQNIKLQLTEAAAESDDELLEKYFAEGSLSDEEIIAGIKKGIAAGSAIPVLAGSGINNKGIINLLDAIVKCMPSYSEKGKVKAIDESGAEIELDAAEDAPFTAFVFKTIADPFVGKMNLFKVMSGRVRGGMTVYNSAKEKQERINNILILKGKKQEIVDGLSAGDIGAFAKLQYTGTGDTLCNPSRKVKFPPLEFPQPVLSMACYAVKQGEEDKIFGGLARLNEEDVTFSDTKNRDTNEILINGMGGRTSTSSPKAQGKFGAEMAVKRLRFHIRKPQDVAAGATQKANGRPWPIRPVKWVRALSDGSSYSMRVVGGTVPKQYFPAVGLRRAFKGASWRAIRHQPEAVLYDGGYHEVDSSRNPLR